MTSTSTTIGELDTRRPAEHTWFRKFLNLEPINLLWLAIFLFLLVLVAAPIGYLIKVSFEATGTGVFTLGNYISAYGRSRYVSGRVNCGRLGLATAAVCVVIAVPMAWAVSRSNMPMKWLAWAVVLGSFILPPDLSAIGWILMAGPNSGWLNWGWMWLTGAELGRASGRERVER